MSKRETYELAKEYRKSLGVQKSPQLSLAFDDFPETSARTLLAEYLPLRFAIHNADLMDEERLVVEQHLMSGKLDVVFATSTLAAGVNYPLGTAVFGSWKRWDSDRREYIPIDASEFHNMAGRAGRMGFDHAEGHVIFVADSERDVQASRPYLNISDLPTLQARISPRRFDQLALQLVASGICSSRGEIDKLIQGTFSGLRERDRNATAFETWPRVLAEAVNGLIAEGFLVETSQGRLAATPAGKAVAYSGLLPATAAFLLRYAAAQAKNLARLLPTSKNAGKSDVLAYVLFVACYSSPEFRPHGNDYPTRFLPWPLDRSTLVDAEPFRDLLPEPVWQADLYPINAAYLTDRWMDGAALHDLERELPDLTAGMIRDMFRNLVWCIQGFANLLAAAADPKVSPALCPPSLRGKTIPWTELRRLPRVMRRLSYRVGEGLPDDVLWMAGLNTEDAPYRLRRSEILELRRNGLVTPEKVMLGDKAADEIRVKVFKQAKPTPNAKANWLRDAARQWKNRERKEAAGRHRKRAQKCEHARLVELFYEAIGNDFEKVFEEILSVLRIQWLKLDDRSKTGAPDYLVTLEGAAPLVVELKSREGDRLVDYGRATEVLAASEVHGHKDKYCVTLCHPGVDPAVPMVIADCGRLSVVESPDLGEALLRLCEGALTQQQVNQWLTTPGQALASDLPYREHGPVRRK
jgi:helicase